MRILLTLALFLSGSGAVRAADPPQREPVDQAVDKALAYLQRTQGSDGAWRVEPVGTRRLRAPERPHVALTSLAVMAFLSAGHVPGEGRYGHTVEEGVRWVLRQQLPNGLLASDGYGEMYHHGISTLMLAEAAGMTEGPLAREVREKLEKAVRLILQGQRKDQHGVHRGGWRYQVQGTDSDISVTGWQVMALRAAKNLGCDVPPEAIDRAVAYVKRCQDPFSGGFRYHPGAAVTVPCTGTSILALEICGKDQHNTPEVKKAGAFLLRNPPRYGSGHFYYSIYYGSQATFQLGDNYWGFYRPELHRALLRNQNDDGSWYGGDSDSRQFGPAYCTAMAVLALTVEYRFLPIYQRGEEPAEKP